MKVSFESLMIICWDKQTEREREIFYYEKDQGWDEIFARLYNLELYNLQELYNLIIISGCDIKLRVSSNGALVSH